MNISNLLFPPVCYACNIRIPDQALCLCSDCQTHLYRRKGNLLGNFELENVTFDTAIALYFYNYMMRQLIHIFKYSKKLVLGRYFSLLAEDILKAEYPDFISADIAVGVPMINVRLRERGFNQAAFLCEHIAKGLGMPDATKYITRKGSAIHQSLLNRTQRLANADTLYNLKKGACFTDKTVLLIDDVFTTGATANELSSFLKSCGAKKVYVMAIASGAEN